jgi:uncharacterized protein YbjT (DUF2867 family)
MTRRLAVTGLLIALLAARTGVAAEHPPRDVLVLGGTGALGAEIVRLLVGAGDRVTVFTRAGSDRSRLTSLPVDFATGDLMQPGDIARAFSSRKFTAVIVAVRVQDGDIHFYEKFMGPLTREARAAGVPQIVHHGAVGAGANAAKFATLGWEKVPGLLDRLKDQGVGEDILRTSGVPSTIIRNTRLWPDGTPATGRASLTEDDTVIDAMTRKDLARLTIDCLGNRSCLGKTYHVKDGTLAWPPPRPNAASGAGPAPR